MTAQAENCANCGGTIGRLEKPYIFEDQVVCKPCHSKLTSSSEPAADQIAREMAKEVHEESKEEVRRRMGGTGSVPYAGRGYPSERMKVAESQSGGQQLFIFMAVLGVPLAIVGGWMANAAESSGRYEWMRTPGVLMLLVGGLSFVVGFFGFAISRIRQ